MKLVFGVALFAVSVQAGPIAGQTEPLTEAHVSIVDLDKDGAISVPEYRVYSSTAFIALDTDNDNSLTSDEASPAISGDLFKDMDKDADAAVSRAEYDTQVMLDFHEADLDKSGALD